MHAVIIHKEVFFLEEHAIQAMQKLEEMETRYGRDVFNRKREGCEITHMTYEHVWPGQLDGMFRQQMESLDNKLATGAAKRTSRNGYDPSIDDDEEDY